MTWVLGTAMLAFAQAQSPQFLQKTSSMDSPEASAPAQGNSSGSDAPAQEVAVESNMTLEVEAAWYARRSTASLSCSHWWPSRGTCSGTIYGPCPGSAGEYFTCSGDFSGNDGSMSHSRSCNACGFFQAPRYALWMFGILEQDGVCHGSFSQGGGHSQRTCIGRCPGGGEYSCSASRTPSASVHLACSSTCTQWTLP